MNTLREFSPIVEEYSIDESFVDLSGFSLSRVQELATEIKLRVHQNTGIPVGVGVGKTKALSKLANRYAKKEPKNNGVYVVDSEEKRVQLLQKILVKDVWGIGRKHAVRVEQTGARTAYDFSKLPVAWVRKNMSVIGERLWRELQGLPCNELVPVPNAKKGIGTAKSFGYKLRDYGLIEEACASYVSEVSDLLRQQNCAAGKIEIFLTTNRFSEIDKQYRNKIVIELDTPSASTIKLTKEALRGLKQIYRPGFLYKKVGVNLFNLVPNNKVQYSLFDFKEKIECDELTGAIDAMNNKFGKNKVKVATVGNREKQWALIKEHRSPRYTTQWDELLTIGKA